MSKKITKKKKKFLLNILIIKLNLLQYLILLNHIKKKIKKANLFFLIGADNLVKFHKWNNWKKIPKFAKIVVFPRKNYSIKKINNCVKKT